MKDSEVKEMLLTIRRNPGAIDYLACRYCTQASECADRDDGCHQTDEQAVEIFMKHYKGDI